MLLVGAEDVEVLQPGHLAQQTLPQEPEIKGLLGVAVGIEGPQAVQIVRTFVVSETEAAIAIGGGAGGIDEVRVGF